MKIKADFIVDEVCVGDIANQCKKSIDNIGMIIRIRFNRVGYQMQQNFSPLLFNPSIILDFFPCILGLNKRGGKFVASGSMHNHTV